MTQVFLCSHAPFSNELRSKFQTFIVKIYDKFIGHRTINKFDKVLAISNWEIPHLLNLGAEKDRIIYSPNGIPDEFFHLESSVDPIEGKILFLGRVAPKKRIETLLNAREFIKDKDYYIEIVGPQEEKYMNYLQEFDQGRIVFFPPVYKLKDKIEVIDSCSVFVLPSRVEGQPQALIEALARGKTVVASDSIAIRDLIEDGKNGYLFEYDNAKSLAEKIDFALQHPINPQVAIKSVEKFNWNILIKKLEKLCSMKKEIKIKSTEDIQREMEIFERKI